MTISRPAWDPARATIVAYHCTQVAWTCMRWLASAACAILSNSSMLSLCAVLVAVQEGGHPLLEHAHHRPHGRRGRHVPLLHRCPGVAKSSGICLSRENQSAGVSTYHKTVPASSLTRQSHFEASREQQIMPLAVGTVLGPSDMPAWPKGAIMAVQRGWYSKIGACCGRAGGCDGG